MIVETEKDLQNLINNKIQEDTNIDYKEPNFSTPNFNQELVKDVSAMANSDGGIIIYGIKEENYFPKEIVWVERDEGYKERIEQIISSKIFRKIEGINVKKVQSDDGNKFVIVIDIPQSDIAPHQIHLDSERRKYYKRHGSISKEMEHYEIEDLFFKRKSPSLKIILTHIFDPERTRLDIGISNLGKVIAEKTMIFLKVPREFEITNDNWVKTEEYGNYKKFEYYQREIPFYPEIIANVGQLYTPKKKTRANKLKIIFMITCKDMPAKSGELRIEMDLGSRTNYIEEIYQELDLSSSPLVIWDEFQL
ncbi:MAG: ATP-binding protein [archaeon]|nr:ATP-binding protein [archaeon]